MGFKKNKEDCALKDVNFGHKFPQRWEFPAPNFVFMEVSSKLKLKGVEQQLSCLPMMALVWSRMHNSKYVSK